MVKSCGLELVNLLKSIGGASFTVVFFHKAGHLHAMVAVYFILGRGRGFVIWSLL